MFAFEGQSTGAPRKPRVSRKTEGLKNDASLENALGAIDEMGGPRGLPRGFGDIKSAFEGQSTGLYSANPGIFNPESMGFGLSEGFPLQRVQSAPSQLSSMNIREEYTKQTQSHSGSPKGAPDGPPKKGLAHPRTNGGKSKRSKKSKHSKKNKMSKKSRKSKKSKAKKSKKSKRNRNSRKHK
jgi:hypothetical protein